MQAFTLNVTDKNLASTIAVQKTQWESCISGVRCFHIEVGEAMADTSTGSTVPRRQLGRYLRDLRNAAGLTVRDAARGLGWAEGKVGGIEAGREGLPGR